MYPPVPPGNSHKMPNAGGGDPARPWAREQREQPLHVWGGCTRVWQACARAQVILHVGVGARRCVHVGPAAGCVRAWGCVCMAHVCASSCMCAPCSAATAWGREAGGGWLCRVTPCHTVSCPVTPRCAMSRRVTPCRPVPCHLMPCRASHPTTLCQPHSPSPCLAPPLGKHQLGWFCPKAGAPVLAAPSTVFPPLLGASHGCPRGGGCCPPAPRLQPPLFTAISTFSRRRREAPHVPAVQ